MKHFSILFVVLITVILSIFIACDNKPTDPVRDNPFDPNNRETKGDPLHLTAKIANGGITLEWIIPEFDALKMFDIFRSDSEKTGYTQLATLAADKMQYVDTNIKNGHSYWYRVAIVNTDYEVENISNAASVNINTEPVLVINGGEDYTSGREATLTILAITAKQIMLANSSDFSGVNWEDYITSKNWTLPTGKGQKTVYMKVKYDSTESDVIQTSILPQEVSNYTFSINDSDTSNTLDVTLNIHAEYSTKMIISNDSIFVEATWEDYSETKAWHFDFSKVTDSKAKVYIKFKNDFDMETDVIKDEIYLNLVSGILINNGSEYTDSRSVILTLISAYDDGMIISENENFSGVDWESYLEKKNMTLPVGTGPFILYAKFKDLSGFISEVYSDTINPMPINPAIIIANGDQYTKNCDVQLTLTASGANLQMKLSEDSTFLGIDWQSYSAIPTFQLSTGDGIKKIFARIKNDFEIESENLKDAIVMDTTPPSIALTVIPDSGITNETDFQFDPTASNDNLASAQDLKVRFDYENEGSFDADWIQLSIINYQFTLGGGSKTVKMQLTDAAGWHVDTTVTVFVNTRPQVSFSATMVDNYNYKLYNFDASLSSDYEDGANLKYRWDFDNDTIWDTIWLTKDTVSYEYADYGDYMVKLEVRDQNSLINDKTIQVTVTSSVKDIDGNVYKAIKIGDQWWMTENLKVTHYRNGDAIPNVTNNTSWSVLSTGAMCAYNNFNDNIAIYGLLYNWFAVDDNRQLAPEGWHIPTDEEWKQLEMYLGMSQSEVDKDGSRGTNEGGKLKESGTTHWNSPNTGATNEIGFTAIPGGWRTDNNGTFNYIGSHVYFWSSTEYSSDHDAAWRRDLDFNNSEIIRVIDGKSNGFSVRLLRD